MIRKRESKIYLNRKKSEWEIEILFVQSPFFFQVTESIHKPFESQVHIRDQVIRSNKKKKTELSTYTD
jgi:hypothetical protein